MQVGIIGAGFVGESMARALLAAGHTVVLSSRTPAGEHMTALVADLGAGARAATVAEVVDGCDVLFLALRWEAIPDAVATTDAWTGKVLIDAANRLDARERSPSHELQDLTGARVVKAFNAIGAEHYQDPVFAGERAAMFLCGDDAEARAVTATLAGDLGFETVDLGDLEHAPILDALARLWIVRMFQTGERNVAMVWAHRERPDPA